MLFANVFVFSGQLYYLRCGHLLTNTDSLCCTEFGELFQAFHCPNSHEISAGFSEEINLKYFFGPWISFCGHWCNHCVFQVCLGLSAIRHRSFTLSWKWRNGILVRLQTGYPSRCAASPVQWGTSRTLRRTVAGPVPHAGRTR